MHPLRCHRHVSNLPLMFIRVEPEDKPLPELPQVMKHAPVRVPVAVKPPPPYPRRPLRRVTAEQVESHLGPEMVTEQFHEQPENIHLLDDKMRSEVSPVRKITCCYFHVPTSGIEPESLHYEYSVSCQLHHVGLKLYVFPHVPTFYSSDIRHGNSISISQNTI